MPQQLPMHPPLQIFRRSRYLQYYKTAETSHLSSLATETSIMFYQDVPLSDPLPFLSLPLPLFL